jgi:hypothetical protein
MNNLIIVAPGVLISVISLHGSALGHENTAMVIDVNGKTPGTIGGLLIKAVAAQQARMKTALRSLEDMAINLTVDDNFILFDIDTTEDHQKLLEYYRDSVIMI